MMIHVLFVCLGNICRSPLAQGIFEDIVEQRGWQDFFQIDSAGTSAFQQNEKPHHGSIAVAEQHGIDLHTQRSRPVSLADGSAFDYLVAMDKDNYHSLLYEFGVPKEKTFLVRGFSSDNSLGNSSVDYQNKNPADVPDPYGKGEKAFELVFTLLYDSLNNFADYLKQQHPDLP